MFIGRYNELAQLARFYQENKFQCIIIWGRRRVGKTTLINEFIKDKLAIYFMATDTTAQDNLISFSESIAGMDGSAGSNAPVYQSFEQALNAVGEMASNKQLVLVIDEYPYLAKSYKPISSLLQKLIDLRFKRDSKLFIILCGSSMSFMERQVLGYQSPLYGRRTGQLQIMPFNFYECKSYFQHFTDEELAVIYGITGGIPQYMSFFNDELTIKENIIRNFLAPSGYLLEEPENLLQQEMRQPAIYNAIIKAIANGSSKNSEISSKVGLNSSAIANYLEKLLELGIVDKETPVGSKESRKTIYAIKDNLFRFWYRFIPGNIALIQRGKAEAAWNNIEVLLQSYMGKVFEDICCDYLWQHYDELPCAFLEIGRWWGSNPQLKRQEELDIVAANDDSAIVAECKWRKEKTDIDVVETLLMRAKLLSYRQMYYYVFSKSGFTARCVQFAEEHNVILVSYADMV